MHTGCHYPGQFRPETSQQSAVGSTTADAILAVTALK